MGKSGWRRPEVHHRRREGVFPGAKGRCPPPSSTCLVVMSTDTLWDQSKLKMAAASGVYWCSSVHRTGSWWRRAPATRCRSTRFPMANPMESWPGSPPMPRTSPSTAAARGSPPGPGTFRSSLTWKNRINKNQRRSGNMAPSECGDQPTPSKEIISSGGICLCARFLKPRKRVQNTRLFKTTFLLFPGAGLMLFYLFPARNGKAEPNQRLNQSHNLIWFQPKTQIRKILHLKQSRDSFIFGPWSWVGTCCVPRIFRCEVFQVTGQIHRFLLR